MDLLRVRAVRFAQLVAILLVLDEAVKPPPEPDPDIVAPPFEECTEEALQRVIAALEEKILEEEIRNSKERPPTPTEILTLLVSKMASLERYERRAFSRRKHALRALIELGT